MPEDVTLTIDDLPVTVPAGTSLLGAAQQAGVEDIPTICYHEACTSNGLCRICVVEQEGARTLTPACVAPAAQGMQIHTRTPRVERARRTILEMLNAAVDLSDAPEIQDLITDYSKCVLCWRCVQVCAEDSQYTYAINFSGRGFHTQIDTFFQKPMLETTCVFCGQCVGVCPTGALKPKRQWLLEQGASLDEVMDLTRSKSRRKKPRTDAGT